MNRLLQNVLVRVPSQVRGDITGALASVLVSLPLSMTIGVVAFAPLGKEFAVQGVMAGLFGAIILGAASALFGAKAVLISGPRAASALILSSLITQLLLSDALFFPSGETIEHVIAIAYFAILLAGAIQIASGVLGIGNIVKYIPYPVIAGFVNSSALLIISGQSWVLLDVRRENTFLQEDTFLDLLMRLDEAQPLTILPGFVAIAVMVLAARKLKKVPASLAGLVAGTAVYYAMKGIMKGVDIGTTLGSISESADLDAPPQALTILPSFPVSGMMQGLMAGGDLLAVLLLVVPAALSMAALASLDTAVSLSTLDDITDRRTDFNRELVGQGLGNMASALLGGLIGAGGMVRTKPGYDAGGRTAAMSLFTSLIMFGAVIVFGTYIEHIPRAVIAGLIMVLGFQIFDRWSLSLLRSCCTRYIFKRTTALVDASVIVLVISVALAFDLIVAVGVGILLSVIIFVSRMSRSLVRNVYRGPAIRARSVWDQKTQALIEEHGHKVAVLELEGSIFFGTAGNLGSTVDDLLHDGVTHIVLDTKRVNDIDSTGSLALQRIQQRLISHGGELALSYVLKERRDTSREFQGSDRRAQSSPRYFWTYLKNSGAVEILGEQIFFPDTDTALAQFEENIVCAARADKALGPARARVPEIVQELSLDEVKTIRRLANRKVFTKGEMIFEEGDDGNAIYYISKGRADIFINISATGEKKRVQTLMSGTVFGEMAVLDAKPRAASVVATEDTICYRLDINAFEHIKSQHQAMALKLFNNICLMFSDRVRTANAMISELEK